MTLGPVHPDAEDALAIILGDGPAVVLAAAELLEAQEAAEEHLRGLGEGENDPEGSDTDDDD